MLGNESREGGDSEIIYSRKVVNIHQVRRKAGFFIGYLTAYPDGAEQLDLGGGGLFTVECL